MGYVMHCHIRQYGSFLKCHRHSFAQWVLPIKGELVLNVNQTMTSVNQQHGAFIHSQKSHGYYSQSDDNQFLVIDEPVARCQRRLPSSFKLTPALSEFITWYTNHAFTAAINGSVNDLLLNLLWQPFIQTTDERMLLAYAFIEQQFASPIDVIALANHVSLSISQCQRRFKTAFGMTLQKAWVIQRIKYAKTLLQQGYSIQQTAALVGYQTSSSFCRAFKAIVGKTAKNYQKRIIG